MPLFSYIAKTKDGKTIKGAEDVSTREELVNRLKNQDLFIVSVRELSGKTIPGGLSLFSQRKKGHSSIQLLDLAFFARNLSTTLAAGVPLLRSLEVLSSQTESGKLRATTIEIINDIKRGLSLSESIARYPRIFSSLWRGITEVGEATGNLPFVLEKLAAYLEMRLDFERKVKGALVYPVILVVVASMAMFVFFKVILPKFTSLFDQFDITLPLPTQILFNISEFVNTHFLVIVVLVGGIIAAGYYAKRQPAVLRLVDQISLQIPLVNDVTILTCVERFASTMYILLESGVPIVYTLEVVGKSIGNSVLTAKILSLKENVKQGKPLSSEIAKIPFFPTLVTELVNIGEEAGNLPEMFKKLSDHYQKELSSKIDRLLAMFEPLMIVFMGVIIGGIVISLFLPLFQLSSGGGG